MPVINSVAKRYDGSAIDYVSIFNWSNGKCIAQVVPDVTGAWEYEYFATLKVGISYIANGCAPITHGPYDLVSEITPYKWWRLTNMVMQSAVSFGQIRFIARTGEESLDPTKAAARSTYPVGGAYEVGNAFNGINSGRFYHNNGPVGDEWISYEFDYPVEVVDLVISARWDGSGRGQELQTADIEVSNDGINWAKYCSIAPLMPPSRPTITVKIALQDV